MGEQSMLIHLAAGGVAGTVGSMLTCPLEVVKTRFQASSTSYERLHHSLKEQANSMKLSSHLNSKPQSSCYTSLNVNLNNLIRNTHLTHHHKNVITNGLSFDAPVNNNQFQYSLTKPSATHPRLGSGIYLHLRFIVEHEGYRALFKGLLPNIVGVAPYRAIYFFSYANAKKYLLNVFGEETTILHILSAYCAGFTAVSITNPIWFVKTRLQLDESKHGMNTVDMVKNIFKTKGILGFYKGISASYFGITETALYFVIYEKLKSLNKEMTAGDSTERMKFLAIFFSAGFSKTFASCLCYPHEVARTRLRQEGSKYNGFFQTLGLVAREEGVRGLYKGMATHLIRQIPNTAIVMTTYELLVRYFE